MKSYTKRMIGPFRTNLASHNTPAD